MAYMFQFGRTDVFLATLLPTSSLKWKIIAQPVWNPWHCAALRIVCSHRIFHLSVMQTSKVSGLRWGVLPNVGDLTGRTMGFHQWIWHKGYWLSSNTGVTPCYCSCQRKMILDHLNHSKKIAGSTFCDKSISKTQAYEAFSIGSHTSQWGGQSHEFIRSVNNVEPYIYILMVNGSRGFTISMWICFAIFGGWRKTAKLRIWPVKMCLERRNLFASSVDDFLASPRSPNCAS